MMRASSQYARLRLGFSALACFEGAATGGGGLVSSNVTWPALSSGLGLAIDGRGTKAGCAAGAGSTCTGVAADGAATTGGGTPTACGGATAGGGATTACGGAGAITG